MTAPPPPDRNDQSGANSTPDPTTPADTPHAPASGATGTTSTADRFGDSPDTDGGGTATALGAEASGIEADTPATQAVQTPAPPAPTPPSGVLIVAPAPADTSVFEHALALARCGLRVIFVHAPMFGDQGERIPNEQHPAATGCTCKKPDCPEKHRGKQPIASAWQKIATADETGLRDQYARLRIASPNLGIVLGEQPGGLYLIAIDIDSEARRQELVAECGPLPETASCESARGPKLLYALPPDAPLDRVKNVTGLGDKPGVDVKVRNGQVVVAPSMHPSGKRYAWSLTGPVAELPAAWVLAILGPPEKPKAKSTYTPGSMRDTAREQKRARAYLEKAVTAEASLLARTTEGGRNDSLYRSLCRLLPLAHCRDMPPGSHEYVVQELSAAAKVAGLGDQEIAATVASAERKVGDQVRDMPPPKEPPTAPGGSASNGSAPPPDVEPSETDPEVVAPYDPSGRTIRITTDIYGMTNAASRALRNDPVTFERNDLLVHVTHVTREEVERSPLVETETGPRHALVEGTPRIHEVELPTLKERLCVVANFQKFNAKKGKWVPARPDKDVVAALLLRRRWPGVRHLRGIIEHPTLREDGSVLQGDQPCYDEATGLLYYPNAKFPPVPPSPTQDDATRAYSQIADSLFGDFLHEDDARDEEGRLVRPGAHKAVPIAHLLTGVVPDPAGIEDGGDRWLRGRTFCVNGELSGGVSEPLEMRNKEVHVSVPLETTESTRCFEHADEHPTKHHGAVVPAFHAPCCRADALVKVLDGVRRG